MYAVSSTFLETLRKSHTAVARVDVFRNGASVYTDLPFVAGEVAVGTGNGVRRTLSLTVPDPSLWDTLAPLGTEIRPYRGVRWEGVALPELVPLGVFGIDAQALTIGEGSAIAISAPDRWARVARARFKTPFASTPGLKVTDQILALVVGAGGSVGTPLITATSTAKVGALLWPRDRDKAIQDLAASIGAEVFFDWTGSLVIRDAPKLSGTVIPWRIDVSASGVLISGERSRRLEKTYNVVVVTSSNVDGSPPFAPQIVSDTDPASPTYVGTLGEIPYFYSSPVITTAPQAIAAGRTLLNKVKGLASQLDAEAAVNPALDRGDVFYAVLPDGSVERHMTDSFNVPLTLDAAQSISTISTRPEGDVPSEE